ncbi:MAG TPA: Holliday junction resolvase RuvX [Rhodanobacteraceae bacterium]
MTTALGFDVGTRLIGVAIGNSFTGNARPLDVIRVRDGEPDWAFLDRLVKQWSPDTLVVGLPLTLDGGNQPITRHARRFAEQAGQRYKLPVAMRDERHSSQEAARRFANARAAGTQKRRDAEKIDALAAAVILEAWLGAAPARP